MVLLSSIQPEAETLDFPPLEHKQRQHCHVKQSGNDVEGCRSKKVLVQPNMSVFLQYSVKGLALEKYRMKRLLN